MAERVVVTFSNENNILSHYWGLKAPFEPSRVSGSGAKRLTARGRAETFFKPSHLGYQADAEHRRLKTRNGLIEGGKSIELYDQAHPGRRTRRSI